jgi:hypothetical protein
VTVEGVTHALAMAWMGDNYGPPTKGNHRQLVLSYGQ